MSYAVTQGLARCFSPWSPQTLILLLARRCWEKTSDGLGLGGKHWNWKLFWKKTSAFQDLILPLIPAIKGLFEIPCYLSVHNDMDIISFEAIQLSTQGSERQRKDVVCYTYSWTFSSLFLPMWFFGFCKLAALTRYCYLQLASLKPRSWSSVSVSSFW